VEKAAAPLDAAIENITKDLPALVSQIFPETFL